VTLAVDLAKVNAHATRGAIKVAARSSVCAAAPARIYVVESVPSVGSVGAGVVDTTRGGTSYTVGNCSAALP